MTLFTKRHVTYLALFFPAMVYLVLMFSAIGQVCFKVEPDQINFKERYLKLMSNIQRDMDFSDSVPYDSKDLRKLLHTRNTRGLSYASHYSSSSLSRESPNNDANYSFSSRQTLIHNCSSISQMKIRNKIGHGVSKQAYIAEYKGTQVAIKMVTRHIYEVKTCLEQLRKAKIAEMQIEDRIQFGGMSDSENYAKEALSSVGESNSLTSLQDLNALGSSYPISPVQKLPQPEITPRERQRCYTFPTARLMKEILLSEQLRHHNLARLLGFCVRSEESDSTDISEHGVISVYELGSRFVLDNLQILPWQTRLRHAIEMSDFLNYLQHSPIGSLVVPDFKEGHLVMVNSSLKLIDLDDVNNLEPECLVHNGKENPCPYHLRCVRALCEGFNAKENLKNMNKLVFKRLLFPLTFPQSVMGRIGQINADLDSLTLTAQDLKLKLLEIQEFLRKEGSK